MKLAEVKIGETYTARVSGVLVPVTILRETTRTTLGKFDYSANRWSRREKTGWIARNNSTGREVTIKSAAKLRRIVRPTYSEAMAQIDDRSEEKTAAMEAGLL